MQINSISWIIHQQRVKLKFKYNSLTHNIHKCIIHCDDDECDAKEACKDVESTAIPRANTPHEERSAAGASKTYT